jgi:uncharacterized protein
MSTNSRARSLSAGNAAGALSAKLAARARQPLRPRHVPQRTCIACRSTSAKREFVRVVRTADGRIEIDTTGKKAGRGAYLCSRSGCWEQALKRDRFSAALKTKLHPEDAALLRAYSEGLPAE